MANRFVSENVREVLVAEDNPDDFELTRLAFEQAGSPLHLECVENGAECLARLRREGRYRGLALPHLLLLDINMPMVDGFQVLSAINADPSLRFLPVIVFTTSDAPSDVMKMHHLRCSSYIKKPVDFQQFVTVARSISHYWCSIAKVPVRA